MLQDPNHWEANLHTLAVVVIIGMILIVYIRGGAKSAFPVCCCASLEGQPVFGVVDEDLVHLVLRDAPRQHLRHDVVQDVRVAMAAVLGEAVLGVDVVRDQHLVLVALLDEKRQAAATRERMTTSGKEHTAMVNLPACRCCICALFVA